MFVVAGNALIKYKGGVILVSHDERLLKMVCQELWVCSRVSGVLSCLILSLSYFCPGCLILSLSYFFPSCFILSLSYFFPSCLIFSLSYFFPSCFILPLSYFSYFSPFCLNFVRVV